MEDLTAKLSEFGFVRIIKAKTVFTLLITGENLSKSSTVAGIMELVLDEMADDYPVMEAMRNDKDFSCLILAPKEE